MLWLALGTALAGPPEATTVVGKEIFPSKEAADLVLRARALDPRFSRDPDRKKAIELYAKAVALNPRAAINAPLANRIAQLYAFPYDPKQGVHPDRGKAIAWWRRCANHSSPAQVLWAQARMGIGCTAFLAGRQDQAVEGFEAILQVDPDGVEWPAWRVKPDTATAGGKRAYENEMARMRADARRIRVKAVDKLHYCLVRVDGAAAVARLLDVAARHEGTPAAAHAQKLAEKALRQAGPGLYQYRESELALADLATALDTEAPSVPWPATPATCEETRTREDTAPLTSKVGSPSQGVSPKTKSLSAVADEVGWIPRPAALALGVVAFVITLGCVAARRFVHRRAR